MPPQEGGAPQTSQSFFMHFLGSYGICEEEEKAPPQGGGAIQTHGEQVVIFHDLSGRCVHDVHDLGPTRFWRRGDRMRSFL